MHIDGFVFFCQVFNFLLLVYLLKRFLYGRILKAMDEREAKIAARFAEAEELKQKADQAAELYEKRNQMLNEAQDKMLNEAAMAAEAKRKELMEDVRRDVEQLKARWQDMLLREQNAFFGELRQRAAKQLYETARRALGDLAGADLEERIVDEFIRRISSLDAEKSVQMRDAIQVGGNQVTVQSAFSLSETKKTQLEQALKKQISNGFTLRYVRKPEIVSGIELRVNGHKIAWSFNEYLETLIESMMETIQKEAHAA